MIWFLLFVGILLIIFNINAIKKDKKSFSNVFHNTEEDMKEFDIKLGEMRREFSETILELQKEILELKKNQNNDTNISEDEFENEANIKIEEEVESKESIEENNNKSLNSNNVKIDEINKLLLEGLSLEEISIKLGISKGEVLLIKELYLK